jgi:hypothetical protein
LTNRHTKLDVAVALAAAAAAAAAVEINFNIFLVGLFLCIFQLWTTRGGQYSWILKLSVHGIASHVI